MNLDLTGKRAIVCGSTQGLGYASAREIAALGASVTLIARDEQRLRNAMKGMDASRGQDHHYLVADFSKPQTLRDKLAQHSSGTYPAHILVNNTGGPKGGPLTEASEEELLMAFQSHVICNHILMNAVLPFMKAAGYGRILNII
ncbi:MAG: SDR family NAD(P)-dependent oxidoreductase, partial [Bacteroidota bacterium]|nr:SDR family NAD(P)-dependent oxidoreductase [Bacteroidota bacterium]